ncbi:DUF368 domain-containing protein [Hazenella sp. IB182353]|nr:DUF368 domain-containing protein [Polycladospora coralii]MBS7529697.1 DUF368 domain-containing protein [Polycladospora coralii]
MALADSVPGVSGGTIAFVLGFYDKFILSLNHVISGTKKERMESLQFLLKLGIGWITGFILSILFIASLLESNIYEVSSLFLGFIIIAIFLIWKEEKKNLVGQYQNLFFLLIGIVVVWGIIYFNPVTSDESISVAVSGLSFGLGLYIFFAAMVSISAMVLPGISGSTILLIFGLYAPVIMAIKEVLSLNFAYLPAVMIFALGILTGVALTIRGVKYALMHYRSITLYFILGLMIGSLYAVVMGPTSLEIPKEPMSFDTFSILFFIIGGALILLLEKLKTILTH